MTSEGGWRCLFALPIMLGLFSSAAVADELAVRADLKSEAARLLEQGDLTRYAQRATELRRTRERTPGGIWKLSLFYKGPDDWPSKQPDAPIWTRIESVTEAYLREHPDSPPAVVAHARILLAHAWIYRGTGWARNLSPAQRDGFVDFLERTRRVLDEHRDVGSSDPEWYSLRIQVMNGQDVDKQTILALAREALDLEPTYLPVDYVTANALLPKWGGSAELLDRFVALTVAKSSSAEGHQAYARIMFNIARSDPQPFAALTQLGVTWPVLRDSLEQIAAAYPDPWNWNAERAMACLMGTQQDFDGVMRRVAPGRIAVAWFDSAISWSQCEQRQKRAMQSSFAGWTQALISTPPSASFVAAATAGALLALSLVYATRRRSHLEQDRIDPSAIGGSQYPGIYRVSPAWKTGLSLLFGLFFLGAAVAAWVFGVAAPETRDSPQRLTLVFCLAAAAAGAAVYLLDTLTSALILRSDRLQIQELWRVRSIRREDIQTRQVLRPPNSPAVLVLQLKPPAARRIRLPILWQTDSAWDSWFSKIPDVDAEAAKSFEAAVSADPELGATPEDRQLRLARARSIARLAIWANAALIAWAFLYPRPYELVILVLVALPWIAVWIMAREPGIYGFNAPRNSTRPDLTALLISPGFLLMVRALMDVQILDWQRLMWWAVLVTICLVGAIVWALPAAREKPGVAALTLLLLGAYGYGACALGNALLDRSAAASYTAQVYGKHVTGGRQRTPEMRLGPWGPRKAAADVTAPWELYRSTHIGETVCVIVHSGALGVPWYRVTQCQTGPVNHSG